VLLKIPLYAFLSIFACKNDLQKESYTKRIIIVFYYIIMSHCDDLIGTIVNRVYHIETQLGKGEFGTVYKGYHIKNRKQVAIKMEYVDSEIHTLKHETTIINHLYTNGCRSIPAIYWYGMHTDKYRCLVMQNYLCSIHDYTMKKNINANVLGEIMANCIIILEQIHTAYVIHRDIKPQNFMFGEDKSIYLIDFGMATFYLNENKKPIETTELKEYIVGSPKYASYYIHSGLQYQRRDDLISLGYMYIFLQYKGLTWDNFVSPTNMPINNNNNTFHSGMGEIHVNHPRNIERKYKKQLTNLIPELQRLSDNEDCFAITKYMEYCYHLTEIATPNYSGLISLFSSRV